MRNALTWTGIIGLVLFIIVLVIGFKVASAILVAAMYVVVAIFLILLVVYLYRKAKNGIEGRDRR